MGKDDLIEAARLGNYPTCEKILSSKPKKPGPFASLRRGSGGCNSRDSSGYTALHYAALNGHKDIVELLLTYEASCNSADDKGSSPLHLAAWAGHADIVAILLTQGPSIANVNLTNADKETALHSAAQYGHLEAVKHLLEHGADPNIKNCREETPLDLAALYGRTATVGLLLESHPELVGPYTAYGGAMYCHTPLHLASRNGHKDVVDLILATGFDINARTARGTALHEAGLCGKLEVVKSLLEAGIGVELRDQNDRTILEIMDELKTQRTREVIHIILDHMGIRRRAAMTSAASSHGSRAAHSPYDNLSLTQSLDESYSIDLEFGSANTSRASSRCLESPLPHRPLWQQQHPRPAKSVEDMIDRRISSLSTTSGCSDCTTATLQGAKSYGSSFFSGEEMATPKLIHTDSELDTSLSSDNENDGNVSSHSVQDAAAAPAAQSDVEVGGKKNKSKKKSSTLTREAEPPPPAPTVAMPKGTKPTVPAKPSHIRPGLKPVKIPTVDDKVWPVVASQGSSTAPRKPPRRNVSISPVRNVGAVKSRYNTLAAVTRDQTKGSNDGNTRHVRAHHHHHHQSVNVYSSKSGSKSFDELDDILCEKPRKVSAKKKGRRAVSSAADHQTEEPVEDTTRHSCDELMMTRSLHGAGGGVGGENSDTGSQISGSIDCQRCLLNSLSNRTMSLDCDELFNSSRYISQRQYKRKLRRDCPSYATLDRSGRRGSKANKTEEHNDEDMAMEVDDDKNVGMDTLRRMKMVSKTTFKLRSVTVDDLNSGNAAAEDTTAADDDLSLELMEIPLSPTHYDQPGTPDHEPPSALQAENAIQQVLDNIRSESKRMKRSRGTEMDFCYLLPLGTTSWPKPTRATVDKVTTMDIDMQPLRQTTETQRPSETHVHSSPASSVSSSIMLSGAERSHLRLDNLQQHHHLAPAAATTGSNSCGGAVSSDNASINSAPGNLASTNDTGGQQQVSNNRLSTGSDKSQNLSILSPFDEKEEWHKISEIINSFGADIGKDVKESTTPNNSPNDEYPTWKRKEKKLSSVCDWLSYIGLVKYQENFLSNGYDRLEFIGDDILTQQDLIHMGISDEKDRLLLMDAIQRRGVSKGSTATGLEDVNGATVEEWLASLSLEMYLENFRQNLFTTMDRVQSIWDDELTSILDIERIGHRKRILLSLAGRDGINSRFGKVQVEENKMDVDSVSLASSKDESVSLRRKSSPLKTSTTTPPATKKSSDVTASNTLGRSRKKKAAPQPPGMEIKGGKTGSPPPKSNSSTAGKKSKKSITDEFLAFKVKYYAKKSSRDFKGTDTTKSAIESSKKSRGGRQRFLVLSEKDVKILKRDAKEVAATHEVSQVCCVVRDTVNPCVFGYVTTTEAGQGQNVAHVFTTDSPEKASEILSIICEGSVERYQRAPLKHNDKLEPLETTPSPPTSGTASIASSTGGGGTTPPNRFRSDQIVSRMRLFFQGASSSNSSTSSHEKGGRRSQSPCPAEARRKRGGSVDNLLDDLGDVISKETKKKSLSTKNLSLGTSGRSSTVVEEVKITSV